MSHEQSCDFKNLIFGTPPNLPYKDSGQWDIVSGKLLREPPMNRGFSERRWHAWRWIAGQLWSPTAIGHLCQFSALHGQEERMYSSTFCWYRSPPASVLASQCRLYTLCSSFWVWSKFGGTMVMLSLILHLLFHSALNRAPSHRPFPWPLFGAPLFLYTAAL